MSRTKAAKRSRGSNSVLASSSLQKSHGSKREKNCWNYCKRGIIATEYSTSACYQIL